MNRFPQVFRQTLVIASMVVAGGLLGSCGAAHPIDGPGSARDVTGTAVDPITGIPLPGARESNAGI